MDKVEKGRADSRFVASPVRALVFSLVQPATLLVIVLFWAYAPPSVAHNDWTIVTISLGTLIAAQTLEFINPKYPGWRLDLREFLTDLAYVLFFYSVIVNLSPLVNAPLTGVKHVLGISTEWAMDLPFLAQVALALVVVEVGQYWLHRLMHNSSLWWTHAPHHHLTQLNATKSLVGNPVELFLVTLSLLAFFDLTLNAVLCTSSIIATVPAFAHANVRFNPPRWYSYLFTTVEAHSLHHTVGFAETRCNYANTLILCDRVFGTFREGETDVVGQGDRRRLSIREQWMFPLRPLLALASQRPGPPSGPTASGGTTPDPRR